MLDQVERHHGFEHRHLDVRTLPAALALEQRRQDGVRGDQPGGLVGGDGRVVLRRAALRFHQAGAARQALDDVVVGRHAAVRAVLGEAVQADVDQPRIAGQQRLPVEPDGGELLRPDAVHQHVGAVGQRQQRVASVGLLEVEHDALLAAVDAEEDRAHAGFGARAGAARRVAFGRLDLDHVGAVLGQDLAGVGAEHDGAQVEHTDAFEGGHGVFVSLPS